MTEPTSIENWIRISVLGAGSFGVVTLWNHKLTDEFIAIKRCKAAITPKLEERWLKEIELIENSRNQNIIAYKELPSILGKELSKFYNSKLPLLSMEYCSEGNLRYVLLEPENCCGLKENTVKFILNDLQNAISYLHDINIAHRDIKPENIVLQKCDFRKENIYKLIDLGYAKEINSIGVSTVGTLPYLAPEILLGQKYNKSVDYWSFGIVTFEIICGDHPFLPQLNIAERMNYIQKKEVEHIAMCLISNENVKYSMELLQENKINTCLKQDIEKWLRMCFRVDGNKRMLYRNIFNDLKKILSKQILTVFSVYTFELYHYEYTDSTLITTLQDWISRDVKIIKSDQVLLTKTNFSNKFCESDRISNYIKKGYDLTFFVYKRNEFSNIKPIILPKTVKTMLEINQKETSDKFKKIYSQTLHFIYSQDNFVNILKLSVTYLIKYIKLMFIEEKKNVLLLKNDIIKMLNICDCYKNIESKFDCKEVKSKETFSKILTEQTNNLNVSKQIVMDFSKVLNKHNQFLKKQFNFDEKFEELLKSFNKSKINDLYNDVIDVAKKKYGKQEHDCSLLRTSIHILLKRRYILLKNSGLDELFENAWKCAEHYKILSNWHKNYGEIVHSTTTNLNILHLKKLNILCQEIKHNSLVPIAQILKNHQKNLTATILDKENRNLLQSFEKYFDSLCETIHLYNDLFKNTDTT